MAIKSFKCLDTQKLFDGKRVARWVNIERAALRKLEQLDWSSVLDDLRAPPGKRSKAIEKANTAFVSATNGESVLSGALKAHLMWNRGLPLR